MTLEKTFIANTFTYIEALRLCQMKSENSKACFRYTFSHKMLTLFLSFFSHLLNIKFTPGSLIVNKVQVLLGEKLFVGFSNRQGKLECAGTERVGILIPRHNTMTEKMSR